MSTGFQEVSRIIEEIRQLLLNPDAVILDTETTGIRQAEIIELSIIDMQGRVLFDRLIRPRRMEMNRYAQKVHGISLEELRDQPTLPEVLEELSPILDRSLVLAWNAPFDRLMVQRSRRIWGLEPGDFRIRCAMQLYAGLYGRRTLGLQRAIEHRGLQQLHNMHASHRALGDVNLVLELLRAAIGHEADAVLP